MIDILGQIEAPLVVMGDFNADWSEPDSAVRVLVDKLQLHAFEPESGKFSTYRSDDTRLDWILLSRQLKFLRHEVLKDPVSDHLAVVAEIVVAVAPSDPP